MQGQFLQVHQVALLSKILLCNLKFDGCGRLHQVRKQRAHWLPYLKIDWTVLWTCVSM